MNWSGGLANRVLTSHTVISEYSTKTYINSQHRLIAKALCLLRATLNQDRICAPVADCRPHD